MRNFCYSISTTIFFGRGEVKLVGKEIKNLGGTKVLICYGSDRVRQNGLLDTVTLLLEREGIDWYLLSGIKPNPRIDSVREGVQKCRKDGVDFILAIGGGSIIDAAKAIGAGMYYEGDPWDFFSKRIPIKQSLPLASILTLAATGSEMNGNAVISNPETNEKKAAHSALWNPRFSILDPSFTYTVSPYHTAAGVADIISHCLEQYFSPEEDTFLVDRLTESVILSCIHYGPIAYKHGNNYAARSNLLWAGSMALNGNLTAGKTGDWAVHAIEHELSAHYDITHGVGLAVIYPAWMEYVLCDDNKEKFCELSARVWKIDQEESLIMARKGIECLKEFFHNLGLPQSLHELGVSRDDLEMMAGNITHSGSIGVFKKLSFQDVKNILESCY